MIFDFLKKNWLIVVIISLGAFFRLYNIDGYMTFLGDEGRDSIIVRNLLVKADPILIGPGTSVGGMYLGPLYYYFMAPFLLLANFSPVGPAVGVALLGVATTYLIYLVGKEWFGNKAGLIAGLFFAISPTVITYSHSSWNPNIMPFFSLLSIYSIWKVWSKKQYSWLIVAAISFAFVCQSHYLGVLIAPVLFIFWLLSKVPKKITLISVLIYLFLMSPLLAFDIRHDWMNSRALYKFLTVRDETVAITPWTAIPKAYPIFEQINGSMLTAKNKQPATLISIILLSYFVFIYTSKDKAVNKRYLMPIAWFVFGLIGFGLYKQNVYDHYFGFLFPVPFLLMAGFFEDRFKIKSKFMNIVLCSAILYLVVLNLKNNPLLYHPNNQMQRAQNVANKVLEIAEGKPFNLAVLAERNYEDGYRYFMDIKDANVLHADRWDKKTIADTLIVICEKPKEKCDPTHSAKAEVANFGWSKIDSDFEVDGVIIYKLIHSK
ncbi:MAG: glycosyltransferase family 39 protein [Microgenomates group bacterium]